MVITTMPILVLFIALCWTGQAAAQYVLLLNNGGQITVQSYREDGGMVKFHGFGGEIGLSKSQIKAIRKSGEAVISGLSVTGHAPESSNAAESAPSSSSSDEKPAATLSPKEERAKEENDYQQKLLDVTERLKAARDNYSQTIRGTTSADPSLLTTEAQMKARHDDIVSRALDAQYKASDPAPTRLVTPSPFSTLPSGTVDTQPPPEVSPRYGIALPQYTPRQKELSDLRGQTLELEKERERLIEEMNKKNFGIGKLVE